MRVSLSCGSSADSNNEMMGVTKQTFNRRTAIARMLRKREKNEITQENVNTTEEKGEQLKNVPLAVLLQSKKNKAAVMKLLWMSLAMLAVPMLVFVLVHNIDLLLGTEISSATRGTYGAIAAVVVVNLLLVTYIVMAWKEND